MEKIGRKLIGMILLGIMLFVMVGCGTEEGTATNKVAKFRDYIEMQDGEEFFETTEVDEGTYWTVKEARGIVNKLKDNKDENQEIMSILSAQAQHYDAGGKQNTEYDLYDDVTVIGPVYVAEEDGEIVLRVRTYDVTIVTEPGATVTFLEEEYEADDKGEIEIGNIGPGHYEVTATVEKDGETLKMSDTIFLFEYENFSPNVVLEFNDKKEE